MDSKTNLVGTGHSGRPRIRRIQMKSYRTLPLALLAFAAAQVFNPCIVEARAPEHTFAIGTNDFLLDSQRFEIRCGEIHAARVPREYWHHRLRMAKAMGLNTVCAYLFWNQIEPREGKFDWSGQADVAEFCRIAQEEKLWVILRPGPYSCAEWEMGGLPWWLLKYDDIKLRTRDPRFIDAAKKNLKEVGRVLGPMQITRGGPILMVQVENEYGFLGKDVQYMGELRQALIDAGFNVPLFACNPPYNLKNGFRSDLFPVVNFGSDPAGSFKSLREVLPQGPLMCGEFYPGWFDTWGSPHHTGNTSRYLGDLEYMLKHDESFSIYMAHGGTTFGLWSGADRPFKPDTSIYDYDAPIIEAGWPTEKFFQTRKLYAQYLLPGESFPEPPAKNPVMRLEPVELTGSAPMFANLGKATTSKTPLSMEKYDQGHGCILYRTTIPAGEAGTIDLGAVHDFGFVFLDGKQLGIADRRTSSFKIKNPARTQSATLDVLIEAMGRVNFGEEVHDRKGIRGPVKLDGNELSDWKVFSFPLDKKMLGRLHFQKGAATGPAFWRGSIQVVFFVVLFLVLCLWGFGVVSVSFF